MDDHNIHRSFGYALPVLEQQHEDPNARRQVSRICNSPALCHGKLWRRLFAPKLMEHELARCTYINNYPYVKIYMRNCNPLVHIKASTS